MLDVVARMGETERPISHENSRNLTNRSEKAKRGVPRRRFGDIIPDVTDALSPVIFIDRQKILPDSHLSQVSQYMTRDGAVGSSQGS